jgi:opacity protein-like surface antigen
VRLKVDVSQTIALFVKAGDTNAKVSATAGGVAANATMDGWRVGAGAGIKLGGPFMGLVEYRYGNYVTYGLGFATPVKIERHQGIAGVGYRF